MDREEARQLLGLGPEPLRRDVLRAARNSALRAHHPDVNGGDEAALRRATYWSTRINEAYRTLLAELDEPASDADLPGAGPARQSFDAAAARATRRAQERATAEAEAAREQAARETAARERAARDSAQREAARREQAAQQAAAAAEAPSAPPVVPSAARHGTAAGRLRRHGPAMAAAAVLLVTVGIGLTQAWTAAGGPDRGNTAQAATPTPTPRPIATPSPTPWKAPAVEYYDAWLAVYAAYIEPCYGVPSCDLHVTLEHDDGTDFVLATEIQRLATLFRDEAGLEIDGTPLCPEDRATLYALHASLAAEAELLDGLAPGDTTPDTWRPSTIVPVQHCGIPSMDAVGRGQVVSQLLDEVEVLLAATRAALSTTDSAAVATQGDRLTPLAVRLASATALDYADSTAVVSQPMRSLAWDLIRLSGRLQVARLARDATTLDLVDRSVATVTTTK